MPTFLDLAGAAHPAADSPQALDGVSLQPLLLTAKAPTERTLFWRNGSLKAVRSGSWSLVIMPDSPPELYDLAKDLGQKRNHAAQEPRQVAALQTQLADWERKVTPNKAK
jgi:arylsulfatase A-like enzyme